MKRLIPALLSMGIVLSMNAIALSSDNAIYNAPPQAPTLQSGPDARLAPDAFALLSNDQKRDVYYNHPDLLPDGFDPKDYWDVLHSSGDDGDKSE